MPEALHLRISTTAPSISDDLLWEFISGEDGPLEALSVLPTYPDGSLPTLYFLVGWWGAASDYVSTMRHFASLGFPCRSFSWRGTGQSAGGSFWGHGYETDFLAVLRHFDDARSVVVAHSGALDYLVHALPKLQAGGGHRIEAAIVIAPLARSGSINALKNWLHACHWSEIPSRWFRFLGSNIFGVSWFMRNEAALRCVLLADHVPLDDVRTVWSQIDRCPFGRYVLSLVRYPEFLRYPKAPFCNLGIEHTLLLRPEHDRNFTHAQQIDTAEAIGAELRVLPNTCHQWFADSASFRATVRAMLSWLAEKQLVPKNMGS